MGDILGGDDRSHFDLTARSPRWARSRGVVAVAHPLADPLYVEGALRLEALTHANMGASKSASTRAIE